MNNKPNYKKGTRFEIIELMHLYGIIPCRSLELFDNSETFQKKIKQMEKEGVIERKRAPKDKRHLNIFSFIEYAKYAPQITEHLPKGYSENYNGISHKESYKAMDATNGQNYRPVANANIGILMCAAGIGAKLEDKPALKENRQFGEGCYYYTSKEIKSFTGYKDTVSYEKSKDNKDSIKKISGSRILGLMVSDSGIYAVFCLPNKSMQWQTAGEVKMKAHLNNLLSKKLAMPQSVENGLFFVTRYNDFYKLINPPTETDVKTSENFENLLSVYTYVYCIPDDLTGRKMVEIMKDGYWQENMKEEFLAGYNVTSYANGIACDAFNDNKYILMMMVPEIHKMKNFLAASKKAMTASGTKNNFYVMCFDYQKDLAVRIFGKSCRIAMTSFERYYKKAVKGEIIE